MSEISPKYAFVTGAAKGIGRSIAIQLAIRGYHLLLLDLDKEGLLETVTNLKTDFTQTDIQSLAFDLSKLDHFNEIFDWTSPYHSRLEVIVNNAGFGLNGSFEDMDLDEQLQVIDVNLKALIKLTYLFLPVLKGDKKKYILNVASTAAYQAVPYFTVYSASKAAVLSFNRALRYELRHSSNITLTNLSPGSTDTHFVHRARMGSSLKRLAQRLNMSPDDVAKIGLKGLFAGKSEVIPGFTNLLNAYLPKFVPKILTETVGANIYKSKD